MKNKDQTVSNNENCARNNICIRVRLYTRALATGAVEATWKLHKYQHFKMVLIVGTNKIHFKDHQNFIIHGEDTPIDGFSD